MSGKPNQYEIGLDKTPANYVPLTPLSFIARSAAVYPNHTSAVYEGRRFTWAETYARCRRFASYLSGKGIGEGDTVAAIELELSFLACADESEIRLIAGGMKLATFFYTFTCVVVPLAGGL